MPYRNKTYVVFDGDDIRAYNLMRAWRDNEHIDFNFYDAHDVRGIRSGSEEEAVKIGLRERFANAREVVSLIGERTKFQLRYVRWELEISQEQGLPIIVANLNGMRVHNPDLCPAIMRKYYAVHVSFQPKIIKYAIDNFPAEFYKNRNDDNEDKIRHYDQSVYASLGL